MERSRLDGWIMEKEGASPLARAVIEEIQLKKLNETLARAHRRGGFFAHLPPFLDSLGRLSDLPFTTDNDIIDRGNTMLLVSQADVDRVTSDTTSGTSGPAKRMFYTDGDRDRTTSFFACGISEFVSPGESVMIAMPYSGRGGLGELISAAVRDLGAVPVEFGVGRSYGEIMGAISLHRPDSFIGMPVPLLSLLRLATEWGVPRSLCRALVSADASVEPVTLGIEKLLGSRLFPHYGSREIGLGGAITCSAHAGMHIRENDIIAEIVDPEGRPLPDGEEGELVVTTIGAEAMPLIRYRTGDVARIAGGICPCGSEVRRLGSVRRMHDGGITSLDDALFRLEGLIDYRAMRHGRMLLIEARIVKELGNSINTAAGMVFPDMNIEVRQSLVSPEDGPSYAAKRRIFD